MGRLISLSGDLPLSPPVRPGGPFHAHMPPKVTMVRSQSTSCKAREVNALGGAAQGVDHTKLDRTTLRLGFSLVQASTLEKPR